MPGSPIGESVSRAFGGREIGREGGREERFRWSSESIHRLCLLSAHRDATFSLLEASNPDHLLILAPALPSSLPLPSGLVGYLPSTLPSGLVGYTPDTVARMVESLMTEFNLPLGVNGVKHLMQTVAGLNPEVVEKHARALRQKLGEGAMLESCFRKLIELVEAEMKKVRGVWKEENEESHVCQQTLTLPFYTLIEARGWGSGLFQQQ